MPFSSKNLGSISSNELRSLCYDSGYYLSDDEISWAMSIVDKDGSGHIDHREFTEWWKTSSRFDHLKMLNEEQTEFLSQVVDVFRSYDTNNGGTLDKNEFSHFLQALVDKGLFSHETHQACQFNEIDRGQDGRVHFNELIAWLRHIGLLD